MPRSRVLPRLLPGLLPAVIALAAAPAPAQTVSTLHLSQAVPVDGAMTDGTTLFLAEGAAGDQVHAVDMVTGQVTVALSNLLGPIDVAKDADGLLYATNWRSNTISRGPLGGAATVWTNVGQKPDGLLFRPDGTLWCTLGQRNKVKTIDPAGIVTNLVADSLVINPIGIVEGSDGNVYVGGLRNGVVYRVTDAGAVDSIATVPSSGDYRIGHLEFAQGVLFATALSEHAIYTVTLDGTVSLFAGTPGTAGWDDGPAGAATFTAPNGIAASPSGDKLYVTSALGTYNSVRVIDLAGGATGAPDVAPATGEPRARLRTLGPNPFRSEVRVRFELPRPAAVRLDVIDVAGRRVRALDAGMRGAGAHDAVWDGADDAGVRAAGGVYFVRLRTADGEVSERVVLRR